MKKYVIIGALYFDKLNGNTYHNTKIIDADTGDVYYTGYKYGYGNAWEDSAENYIKSVLGVNEFKTIRGATLNTTKRKAKEGNF